MKDRELDVLIAEKVMGWVWYVSPAIEDRGRWLDRPGYEKKRPEYFKLANGTEPVAAHNDPEYYSTSIVAAWQVIEKIGCRVTLTWLGTGKWSVGFDGITQIASADTAPLAICLAALKWAGVEAPK